MSDAEASRSKDENNGPRVLQPLTEEKAKIEKVRLSESAIQAAIEQGREALAALETAGKHHATLSPKLRFS